jgi:hypothetical protein
MNISYGSFARCVLSNIGYDLMSKESLNSAKKINKKEQDIDLEI